ncbi:L-asparaginase [Natronobacillus azotifigens]|uniref:asparaginase n=1 Tax=Natronobacillus azotifigens TaxID=472978 RepID=A0A9J6R952_9BACI|nr:asparaginase [Natronobacillus azotifigens]MCZ0701843.1 asparaginase [Natronobacillus azotifigens]
MKKILIIHTGGTIAMAEDQKTGAISTAVEHPLTKHFDQMKSMADIHEDFLFDLPSPHITPSHMLDMGIHIEEKLDQESYDGIVVTHGTDTLEETAYFLDLYLDIQVPVVITGAMRSSNEVGSDGLYNLISAIRVASSGEAKEKGILVVMNDEIHSAAYVTKTSTSNVATFQSPQYGPIGILTKQEVYFYHKWISFEKFRIQTVTKKVLLLKVHAGIDVEFIQAITNLSIDGLVIEGFGQGNVPPVFVDPIITLLKKEIPVVVVSRSFEGVVQPTYDYVGGGKQLHDIGVLFAKRLSGPKARIKLMMLLEAKYSYEHIKTLLEL